MVDESQRSPAVTDVESIHAQTRKVPRRAASIGFSGTPLLKSEKSPFDRFGGLIHDYKIDRAVADMVVRSPCKALNLGCMKWLRSR